MVGSTLFKELFDSGFSERPSEIRKQKLPPLNGWRKCVFPLFAQGNRFLGGCGTGFFIEGLDLGVTAEHLLDIERESLPLANADNPYKLDLKGLDYGLTAYLPHQNIAFGSPAIPPSLVQPVETFYFDLVEKDDPFIALKKQRSFKRQSDVLFLRFGDSAELPRIEWRPQISKNTPSAGDWVCAIGFPEIDLKSPKNLNRSVQLLDEGMVMSFARVIEVVSGRGNYEKTSIGFVESDWPSGMSGGPVFDSSGELVGVVSRELIRNVDSGNCGSFTLLADVLQKLVR